MARPATFDTYTLSTAVLPCGTVTIKLHVDAAAAALTVPPDCTLAIASEIIERMDVIPGELEADNVRFSYVEDYSTYANGFWHTVFGYWAEIQLLLNEGSGNTHLFWGKILPPETNEEELYISGTTYVRRGEFQCESLIVALKDSTIASVVSAIQADAIGRTTVISGSTEALYPAGGHDELFIGLPYLISSLLRETYTNSGVSTADAVFGNRVADVEYYQGAAWVDYYDVLMYWGDDSGAPDYAPHGKFLSTDTYYFGVDAKNCYEWLYQLCHTFLLIPRYVYNVSTDRHQVELFTRARSYDAITPTVPISSVLIREAYPPVRQVVQDGEHPANGNEIISITDWVEASAVNSNIDVDVRVKKHFMADEDEDRVFDSSHSLYWLFWQTGGTLSRCTKTRYYDYVLATTTEITATHRGSLARMLYRKFSASKRAYERTYAGLDAGTGTHSNLKCGATTSINDGVGARTFYAAEVRKDVLADRVTVKWFEV